MQFAIAELETIINFFREKYPSADQITLSAPVRHLGDVYGTMIYEGKREVDFTSLSLNQRSAVAQYLNENPHLVRPQAWPTATEGAECDEEAAERPGAL